MDNVKTYICASKGCNRPCVCSVIPSEGQARKPERCVCNTRHKPQWELIGQNLVKFESNTTGEQYTVDDVLEAAGLREDIPDEPAHEDDYERVFIPRRH